MIPVAIVNGMLQQIGNNRADIPWINLGPPQVLSVTSNTVVIAKSVVRLNKGTPGGGVIDVDFINGGIDGDLLVVFGTAVKLKKDDGNLAIDSDFTLQPGKSITLYLDSGNWLELCRRT